MYLPQFQEICEKQGWDFKWSDDGESAYITLMTLPNKHLFIVNKNNFAKEVTALSETYLLDEYAKTSGSCAPIFCEDFAVSTALNALAAALNVAAVEAKTWICTDPDTCQWRRQVGETKFELYDIFEAPDNYFAVHGVVDPAEDLTPSELHQLEDSYDGLLDNSTSESDWITPHLKVNVGLCLQKRNSRQKNFLLSVKSLILLKKQRHRFVQKSKPITSSSQSPTRTTKTMSSGSSAMRSTHEMWQTVSLRLVWMQFAASTNYALLSS